MYNYFHSQGVKIGVLVFDGIMVEKKNITEEEITILLRNCEQYVKEQLQIDIKLVSKPMDESITILEENLSDKSYETIKERFEN